MTEERVYVIMYERGDEPDEGACVDCVVRSLTQAEEYCLRRERENPDFIFFWVASFLTDEP